MNPGTRSSAGQNIETAMPSTNRSECRRCTLRAPSRASALRRLFPGRALCAGRPAASRGSRVFPALVLAAITLLAPPAALLAKPHEQRIVLNRAINKPAVENLQRWVNGGHESWCKDARMVASSELRRIAPDFASAGDLQALPLQTEFLTGTKAVFTWTPLDARAHYRVTVERFAWLLPLAGRRGNIVWVPTRTEIIAHP